MNVIVIIADSLRLDHLSCYGNPQIRTPNIDKLSSEATIFDHAYSEGLPTVPTRTAWFTGRYTFPFRGWQRLEPNDVTLAEILWDKGYTTALITDTYHLHKPTMNFARGFDYVRYIRGQEGDPYVVDESIKVDVERYHKDSGDKDRDEQVRAQMEYYLRNISQYNWWESDEDHFVAQVVKAGIAWLESQTKKDRLFLWLDCFDPHEPWDPPSPFNTMYDPDYKGKEIIQPVPGLVEGYLTKAELKHILALYAGEVTVVDKWVGIFLDRVRELGLFDNSLIIFTTDHGEPFGEHGIIRKARPWPYEELVHIPFILRHPQGIGHGQRIDAFIDTTDLMPTILDFLDIGEHSCSSPFGVWPERIHGCSLLPLISGEKEKIRDYAYSGFYNRSWSIRTKEWSFILWLPSYQPFAGDTPWTLGGIYEVPKKPELYNRKEDPGETHNLIDEEPEIAAALELELRRFVTSLH